MNMFTFLSPLYLVGALAALIPVVIHLSRSRRTKKMRFSTTRFFTDQFLRSYRMSRLREIFLLACRMALFALFAMALAQPLVMPKGPLFGSEGARAVVIVLDNSASMGYTEEYTDIDGQKRRGTLLERAQKGAATVIDSLRPGDVVSVVLAGRRDVGPETLFPNLTPDLSDARQAVLATQVATLGTDLVGAISQAEDLLRGAPASTKEVYVFSDLQKRGWSQREQTAAGVDPSEVAYYFVRVQPQQSVTNRAVVAVHYASARPMAGVPFAIRPLIQVEGEDNRPLEVSLVVDGEKVGQQEVKKLPNGRWAVPTFSHTFTSPGWHSGYIEVQDQTLASDNKRFFTLQILDNVRVLAVNGAPSQVPRLDELFFLRFALTASPEGASSSIQLDTVSPAGLAEADTSKYPLILVANAEQLAEAAVKKLEDFAAEGGSVLCFLGDKVNPTFYNENFTGANRRHGGLLPARLVELVNKFPKDVVPSFGGVNYGHPALASFQDPKNGNLLSTAISLKTYWRLDPDKENAAVLMKSSLGDPVLCEKAFGKGRVMLFASTCDTDWTNFATRPVFLPFMHRLVGYLAQEPLSSQAFHSTGSSVPLPDTDSTSSVLIKKPNGVVGSAVEALDGSGGLAFNDTAQTGVYTILTPDQKSTAGLFAVNLPSYESDLQYLDSALLSLSEMPESAGDSARIEAGLKEELERPFVFYLDDPGKVASVSSTARKGYKLWDYFLMMVLAIGVFEPWLANRISARLYSRPRDAGAALRAAQSLPALSRSAVEVSR